MTEKAKVSLSFIPPQLEAGDLVYNPRFGEGCVTTVYRGPGGDAHILYQSGISRTHLEREFKNVKRTKTRWHMYDSTLANNPIVGYVEIFTYDLQVNTMGSVVKPFYVTPGGRLRFSGLGIPYAQGISRSSLGTVHYKSDKLIMYVLKDDPLKEKYKAFMWRSIAQHLVKARKS